MRTSKVMTKFNIEIEIDCETEIVESEIVEHITKALQPHPHAITKDFENVKVSLQKAGGE